MTDSNSPSVQSQGGGNAEEGGTAFPWHDYIEAVHAIMKRGTGDYELTTIRRCFNGGLPALRAAEILLGNPQSLGG